jgi:hypothetical protein
VEGPLDEEHLGALAVQVAVLIAAAPRPVLCEVREDVPSDLATVDALARLRLAAHRAGGELRLCSAPPRLLALLRFLGLATVLNAPPPTRRGAAAARTAGTSGRCRGRT